MFKYNQLLIWLKYCPSPLSNEHTWFPTQNSTTISSCSLLLQLNLLLICTSAMRVLYESLCVRRARNKSTDNMLLWARDINYSIQWSTLTISQIINSMVFNHSARLLHYYIMVCIIMTHTECSIWRYEIV